MPNPVVVEEEGRGLGGAGAGKEKTDGCDTRRDAPLSDRESTETEADGGGAEAEGREEDEAAEAAPPSGGAAEPLNGGICGTAKSARLSFDVEESCGMCGCLFRGYDERAGGKTSLGVRGPVLSTEAVEFPLLGGRGPSYSLSDAAPNAAANEGTGAGRRDEEAGEGVA